MVFPVRFVCTYKSVWLLLYLYFIAWDQFEPGLLAFAIAHICYTFAFGFKPRDYKKLGFFFGLAVAAYCYIVPGLDGK